MCLLYGEIVLVVKALVVCRLWAKSKMTIENNSVEDPTRSRIAYTINSIRESKDNWKDGTVYGSEIMHTSNSASDDPDSQNVVVRE